MKYLRILLIVLLLISIGTTSTSPTLAKSLGDFEYEYTEDGNIKIIGYNGADVDLTIPNEIEGKPVMSIGKSAFTDKDLASVILPEGLVTIDSDYDKGAFSGNRLITVHFPESLTFIGDRAFAKNQLTSLTLPKRLVFVGLSAFSDNQLTNLALPESLTSIGEGVFAGNRLTSLTLSENLTSIGIRAFAGNQLTSLILPESLTSIGHSAFANNRLTSLTLPESLTSIGPSAFTRNQLIKLNLPEGLASIGDRAFSDNLLTSLTLPKGLTSVGPSAFNSNQLTSLTLPEGLASIGEGAFAGNRLTSLTLPESLTSIDNYAFNANLFNKVYIPKGIIFMGNIVFSKDVSIYGTPGTRAESYAKTFGNPFYNINESPIESITVMGEGGQLAITEHQGTLQMIATILPESIFNKDVLWLVEPISGEATINKDGLLQAAKNGEVKVIATATDGSDLKGSINITISNQMEWDIWEPKYGVVRNKEWKISFNKILSRETIKEGNIYVTNQDGEIIPMYYYQEDRNADKFIHVMPVKDYKVNQTYTLWIKSLKATDGTVLNKNVKMDFTVW